MARYRGTMRGQRGECSRLVSPKSGLSATLNGWDFGVRVELSPDPTTDRDTITITLTSGSNGRGGARCLGTFDTVELVP